MSGGVDLLAHVGLLLGTLNREGAHVLAAGEEHAVDQAMASPTLLLARFFALIWSAYSCLSIPLSLR